MACPSLDIVAVRLGVGSLKSQLPRGEDPQDWGKRVEGFFRLVAGASKIAQPDATRYPPYPPSPAIKAVNWAPVESIVRKAKGGDNWPITWADDGHLYTCYGDGNGFEPGIPDKLSLGFARVEGGPVEFTGVNIRSESGEHKGGGKAGKKAGGMLMVDGVLYLWARQRRQRSARLVVGSCQDMAMERLEAHHQLRLPDVPQLRQELRRCAGRLRLYLLAR